MADLRGTACERCLRSIPSRGCCSCIGRENVMVTHLRSLALAAIDYVEARSTIEAMRYSHLARAQQRELDKAWARLCQVVADKKEQT